MKPRYVVMVKPPEDHPGAVRTFGIFHSRGTADSFCEAVREAVDEVEQNLGEDKATGFAYVASIEPIGLKKARRWAAEGER